MRACLIGLLLLMAGSLIADQVYLKGCFPRTMAKFDDLALADQWPFMPTTLKLRGYVYHCVMLWRVDSDGTCFFHMIAPEPAEYRNARATGLFYAQSTIMVPMCELPKAWREAQVFK